MFVVGLDELAPVRTLGLAALVDCLVEAVAVSVDSEALIVREEHFRQRALIISMEATRSLMLRNERIHPRNLEILIRGWRSIPLHVEQPWRRGVLLDAQGLA